MAFIKIWIWFSSIETLKNSLFPILSITTRKYFFTIILKSTLKWSKNSLKFKQKFSNWAKSISLFSRKISTQILASWSKRLLIMKIFSKCRNGNQDLTKLPFSTFWFSWTTMTIWFLKWSNISNSFRKTSKIKSKKYNKSMMYCGMK